MDKDQIKKRQREIADELKKLLAEAGDGQFTDEQDQRFKELDEESRDNEARLETIEARAEAERRQKRVQQSRAKWGSLQTGTPKVDPFHDLDVRRADTQTVLSRARGLVGEERSEVTEHLSSEQRSHVDKLLRKSNEAYEGSQVARHLLATSREEYRSAFQKVLAGHTDTLDEAERRAVAEVRALSVGTDSAGGFAVPVLIDPTIIMTAQGSPNPVMRLARVEQITTNKWRGLNSAGMTWGFKAEGAVSADNSPTIAQPVIRAHRADGFIPYSMEVEMDWPSFASDMSRVFASGYNELLAQKLTIGAGDGSNEPLGLVTALNTVGGSKVQVATAATIAPNDIYGLWKKLPAAFRMRATTAWMSNTGIENVIRQFGAGANADANFSVNITQDGISRLLGKEYANNDFMADMPAATGTELLAILGDFQHYVVAQRMGMTVERLQMLFDPATGSPTGKRGMVAYARVGGGLVDGGAGFKNLTNK
ncbi:phage major capsid protein [Micromonospora sp. NPDC048999]|uniref:phage major capsid protein n=1 Tax=Micromonospora sp. NPDC048999 TaxID=3155391 RepID=UPI0033DD98DC